jgi:hypothetical protein
VPQELTLGKFTFSKNALLFKDKPETHRDDLSAHAHTHKKKTKKTHAHTWFYNITLSMKIAEG